MKRGDDGGEIDEKGGEDGGDREEKGGGEDGGDREGKGAGVVDEEAKVVEEVTEEGREYVRGFEGEEAEGAECAGAE